MKQEKFNNNPIRLFVLIGFASVLIGLFNSTSAEEMQVLDGDAVTVAEVSKGKLIADFLEVAFSDRMWAEDADSFRRGAYARTLEWFVQHNWQLDHDIGIANKIDILKTPPRQEYEQRMQWMPWLADYIYRPNGWPKRNVIHKWEENITIGIGWPNFSPAQIPDSRGLAPPGSRYNNPGFHYTIPLITQVIHNISPSLSDATGLPVRFLPLDDPQDTTANYARIRIVPTERLYSSRVWHKKLHHSSHPESYEPYLWGAASFESADTSYMDGYLLPDPDNTLGLVVCKVNFRLPESVLKVLVQECLVRAMGLPDFARYHEFSLLGDWRSAAAVDRLHEQQELPEISLPTITEYEKLLIRLLYCPAIKPGADMNEILRILTTDDRCIRNTLKTAQ